MALRFAMLAVALAAAAPAAAQSAKPNPEADRTTIEADAIEGVTHSIVTLEFEAHRPLYDWFIEHLPVPSRPRQYEFARLNLTYTVLSKRVLLRLVTETITYSYGRGTRTAVFVTQISCAPAVS